MPKQKKLVIFDFSGTITNALPDIAEIIKQLAEIYTLAIVSSSSNATIRKYLARFDLHDEFIEILGYDSPGNKSDKMRRLFTQFEVQPAQTVYITDLAIDAQYALQVGAKAIGVSWGLERAYGFEQLGEIEVIDSPFELPEVINRLW